MHHQAMDIRDKIRRTLSCIAAFAVSLIVIPLAGEWIITVATDLGLFSQAGSRFKSVLGEASAFMTAAPALSISSLIVGVLIGLWFDAWMIDRDGKKIASPNNFLQFRQCVDLISEEKLLGNAQLRMQLIRTELVYIKYGRESLIRPTDPWDTIAPLERVIENIKALDRILEPEFPFSDIMAQTLGRDRDVQFSEDMVMDRSKVVEYRRLYLADITGYQILADLSRSVSTRQAQLDAKIAGMLDWDQIKKTINRLELADYISKVHT